MDRYWRVYRYRWVVDRARTDVLPNGQLMDHQIISDWLLMAPRSTRVRHDARSWKSQNLNLVSAYLMAGRGNTAIDTLEVRNSVRRRRGKCWDNRFAACFSSRCT